MMRIATVRSLRNRDCLPRSVTLGASTAETASRTKSLLLWMCGGRLVVDRRSLSASSACGRCYYVSDGFLLFR